MKEISHTEQAPTKKIDAYLCDFCGKEYSTRYTSANEAARSCRIHEAQYHIPKEIKYIERFGALYYFDTPENFKRHQKEAEMATWSGEGEWEGPGWYYIDIYDVGDGESRAAYMTAKNMILNERVAASVTIKACDEAERFIEEHK